MSYDYWAAYSFLHGHTSTQQQVVDYLRQAGQLPSDFRHLAAITDAAARVDLLAQAILTPVKEYARTGLPRQPGGVWELYRSQQFDAHLRTQQQTYLAPLGLLSELPDLAVFSTGAFACHCTFTLRQPYISKDDNSFYIFENPVKKEWVFKVPYVAPSQWKGALRTSMGQQLTVWWQSLNSEQKSERANRKRFVAQRVQLVRFFGTEKGVLVDEGRFESYLDNLGGSKLARWYCRYVRRFLSSSGFLVGRLHFYPTYFTRIGLEVINPHERETGVGKQPIYFESVPQDAEGTFTLLYVPLDHIGEDARETRRQVAADLQLVAEGIQAMMTTYGFGAKTSSGFGLAADALRDGRLQVAGLKAPEEALSRTAIAQMARNLLRSLSESGGRLHPDFRAADGSLVSEAEYQQRVESRGKKYTKTNKQIYARAKRWWEREGKALAEQAKTEPEPPEEQKPTRPPVAKRSFINWIELKSKAAELARLLGEGDA